MDYQLYQKLGADGLKQLAERRPQDPEVHFQLGLALADDENLEAAIDAWIDAERLDSNNEFPVVHFLARTFSDLQKHEAARDLLLASIKRSPDSPFATHSHTLLGSTYEALNEPELARDAYFKAVENDDRNVEITAQEALTRMSLAEGSAIPRPVLRSELVVDEKVEIERDEHSIEFQFRQFRGADFTVILTSSLGKSQVYDNIEGPDGVGAYLSDTYGLNLREVIWVDDGRRDSIGLKGLSLIRPDFGVSGHIDDSTFYPMPIERFEAITGYRLDWRNLEREVAFISESSEMMDPLLIRELNSMLQSTESSDFTSGNRAKSTAADTHVFAFHRTTGDLIAHAALDFLEVWSEEEQNTFRVVAVTDLITRGDSQELTSGIMKEVDSFLQDRSHYSILLGRPEIFENFGYSTFEQPLTPNNQPFRIPGEPNEKHFLVKPASTDSPWPEGETEIRPKTN